MEYFNEMEVVFDSRSENEGFARVAVAAFMTQMDPVLEEVADVKTAVSEAVTNSIIHGYEGRTSGKITVWCGIEKDTQSGSVRGFHDLSHTADLVLEKQEIAALHRTDRTENLFFRDPHVGAAEKDDAVLAFC